MSSATVDGLADIAFPLTPCPDESRAFHVQWPVRLGDTDGNARLRLDAVARYLQDIGYDHLKVVDEGELHQGWIVRRTVIDVLRPIDFGDQVHLRRWPAALSNRWCNMRIQVRSELGGLIEAEMFLIHVDTEAGRPARSHAFSIAARTPSDWSAGVVGALAVTSCPSKARTASVNVPPTSTPRSMRGP